MFDFLKLRKEVSETTADIEADDVLSVKKKLKDMGHYKEPEWGMSAITDNGMFDGIRNFQKEKGLKVDGIMKPQGETENKMNEVLGQKNTSQNNLIFSVDRDKAVRDRMYSVIDQHEYNVEHPYKDTKGYITTGLGSNVDNLEKFNSVKWTDTNGRPISKEEINRHYQNLKNMPNGNYKADMYKNKTTLRIPEAESRRLYDEHINDDLRYLRGTFKDFDRFPPQIQDILIDIKYNTGNVDKDKWPNLHQGIADRNLESIINNVHRKDVGNSRNQWAIEQLRQIKRLDY